MELQKYRILDDSISVDFNRLFEVCNELIHLHISSELKPTVLGWVFFQIKILGVSVLYLQLYL